MMLSSFPIGMLIMFHSDIGEEINFELPLGALIELGDFDLGFFSSITIGDVFVVLWSTYVILFVVAILGPKTGFASTISSMLSRTSTELRSNYMVHIVKWFSIIVFASAVIHLVQESVGITTVPPPIENDLILFFYTSMSPLVEEAGFRVLLIGLPLFAFYSHKMSIRHFFRTLWNPTPNLHIYNARNALILIILAGILFGLAHVMFGGSWTEGKLAQATVSGIILGWVYFRFGFVAALLIHWGINYFVFAYVMLVAQINNITTNAAFLHSMIVTIEALLLISGALSLAVIVGEYYFRLKVQRNF